MKKVWIFTAVLMSLAQYVHAFESAARNAILVDFDTGAYLYTKNHQDKMPPASMSKLMTIYIIFDKLKTGKLSLDDEFTVSENAWRKGGAASGGSTMFLNIGEKVTVDDLLRGIIIQSGNDACIVAAENISGSEEEFATLMNKTAEKLNLKNSSFANSTGLPDEKQMMSAEDLALLARAIIKEYPEYYHIFKQKEFMHNGINQGNRNPLLYSVEGADGLKTGHTSEAGFCLTGSAIRHGQRFIEVIAGLNSNKERSEEAERLMNYGFREFEKYQFFTKGQIIDNVKVWYGEDKTVDMLVKNDVVRLIKKGDGEKYSFKVIYDEPLKAPVKKNDVVGQIEIKSPDATKEIIPLVASKDVGEVGLFTRFVSNIKYYLKGK